MDTLKTKDADLEENIKKVKKTKKIQNLKESIPKNKGIVVPENKL
jgi:hypothetical protein